MRDSAHSVHTTACMIGVTGTLSRQTCPVAKKNDPLDLGRHTKAITPIFYNIQSIKQKKWMKKYFIFNEISLNTLE